MIRKSLWHFAMQTWNNPIVLKELRGRMRGWRAAIVLCIYLAVLGCFTSFIYFAVAEANSYGGSYNASIGPQMGQTLFYSTYILILTMVVFLAPAFTAGAISGERERQTIELLLTTLLPVRSLVLGKLTSALAYVVLLILAALPIHSVAFMFGGLIFAELVIGTLILLVTALIAGSVGIFVSSIMKSSIGSTVLTYALILLSTVGLPIIVGISVSLVGIWISDIDWIFQALLIYIGGFLACTNPFTTAVLSQVVLESEDTLFFFTTQISGNSGTSRTILLVSPWVVYVLFYTLLSIALIFFSVLIIKRKRG